MFLSFGHFDLHHLLLDGLDDLYIRTCLGIILGRGILGIGILGIGILGIGKLGIGILSTVI